ncbi:MAG: peptidoglycan-binding domain-containing protein [Evtepia sp.]|uniref:peptidoglycan-binding domain-containing protein n=1 Tax=Evtepia sp. TaxID=2773933 RepID=UPI002A75AA09|nr:peptidoglycan-binding domain-containing protein [Evtepia sp.]MDY3015213.1 peptidoglycan-binding domain-containing protein [Evtepia sp.]
MTQPSALPSGPIRTLQTMLRALAHQDRDIPPLTPDGFFGEATLEGVMVFQKHHGLPVTGMVDRTTWNALAACTRLRRPHPTPFSLDFFPPDTRTLAPGEAASFLFPIQGMFCALAEVLDQVVPAAPSGTLDPDTMQNFRWVQHAAGKQETGLPDQETWRFLARLYQTFVLENPDHPLR